MRENNTEHKNETVTPVVDIFETAEGYSLELEMPGANKDELNITLEDNTLEIQGGLLSRENNSKETQYSEIKWGDFYRKFKVGSEIERDSIIANYKDGVLTLDLKKSEKVKPKKIEVNTIH